MFKSVQWKIVLLYSLIILLAMQLMGAYLAQSLERYYLRNYAAGLEAQGRLMSTFLERYLVDERQHEESIPELVREFGGSNDLEVSVLDRYGRTLTPLSNESGNVLPTSRQDLVLALSGTRSEAIRYDFKGGGRYYYLALPVKSGQNVVGALYLKGSLEEIDLTLREVKLILISGSALVMGIAMLLGFVLARTITAPIQEVTSRAAALARGEFPDKVKIRSPDEIGRLGEMFNFLARRLKETLQEISAEKTKVETILQSMQEGIVACNHLGEIIHLNPAASRLLGRVNQLNLNDILTRVLPPDTAQQVLLDKKPLFFQEIELEKRIILLQLAAYQDETFPLGWLLVLHDATREKKLVRLQQEFVANVSHELKTPLTTIKSYVETMLHGAARDPVTREKFLKVVAQETERMVNLVRDLLVLSQLDAQQIYLQKEELDLRMLFQDVSEQMSMECDEAGLVLEIDLPPGLPSAWGDHDKIRQVLLNLLENAVKFTPTGGNICLGVDSSAGSPDELAIYIKDSGIGIPLEDLPRIFERFYRVDKTRSRRYGGTGLGMSIARQIVEAHGGSIRVESVLQQGTTIIFTLPLVPDKGSAPTLPVEEVGQPWLKK